MNLATLQQLVRIGLYSVGGLFLGQGVADGELYQQLIGASGVIVAFLWWLLWERNRLESK